MNFKVDQAATFEGLVFLSCEPKAQFGGGQARTKQGLLKWDVQILGAVRNHFGQLSNEVINVGMTGETQPCQGLAPFTPVEMRDFEIGVMEKTKKDEHGNEKVIGVNVWFRCSEVLNVARPAAKAA